MKSLHKTALTALLIALPVSCAQTHGSVAPDTQPEVKSTLTTTGPQHEFLDGLTGQYDVVYNVWNQSDRPCDTFCGTVDYQWNHDGSTLIGQHDGAWGSMPFTSAMMLGFDADEHCYSMGWARQDGSMVLPMGSTDPYAPSRELTVTRGTGDTCTRSVLTIDSSNSHTIKRYSTNENGEEQLVLEIICTRL